MMMMMMIIIITIIIINYSQLDCKRIVWPIKTTHYFPLVKEAKY